MIHPQNISIEDYSYDLPDERIAKFPLEQRDSSKLLVYKQGKIGEDVFRNICNHLPEDLLMVFNNTKVIQARLLFHKETGAHIEIFCLSPSQPADYALAFQAQKHCVWQCMLGNAKKWKEGPLTKEIEVRGKKVLLKAEREGENDRTVNIDFSWEDPDVCFADILDDGGVLPIPPYLKRETQESDKTTYQTVYSKIKGSVAAPTAGLHFTEAVFQKLKEHHIWCEEVTLHVGAGTFQPVKSDTIGGHEMHTEVISVNRSAIVNIKEHLGRIVAVGTTSVRTMESLYYFGILLHQHPDAQADELTVPQWMPYEKDYDISVEQSLQNILDYLDCNHLPAFKAATQIIIAPGYEFKIVKAMVTNFHQPQNTLMLLVAAFVGEDWKRIYDYALSHDFRFLSYGDSSLLMPKGL